MPAGYAESMAYGMIGWAVPLARYPNTYNGQPLGYVALAAQKNYFALYLTCAYQDAAEEAWLADAFARSGKKLDKGKSCVRFRRLEEFAARRHRRLRGAHAGGRVHRAARAREGGRHVRNSCSSEWKWCTPFSRAAE